MLRKTQERSDLVYYKFWNIRIDNEICKSVNLEHKPIWVKVFKNGPSKICGRQPQKVLPDKAVFHKFYLIHS